MGSMNLGHVEVEAHIIILKPGIINLQFYTKEDHSSHSRTVILYHAILPRKTLKANGCINPLKH